MKFKLPKIKKNFKKNKLHLDPDLSWGLLLCLFFIFVLTLGAYGFFLFRHINREQDIPPLPPSTELKKISPDRFEADLKFFEDRMNNSKEILNSPSPFIDPSL
jgi:hypothetical protein